MEKSKDCMDCMGCSIFYMRIEKWNSRLTWVRYVRHRYIRIRLRSNIQTQSEAKSESESELQSEAVAQAQLQQHAQLNIANSDAWTFQSAQIHIKNTHAFFSAFVFERIERHGITLDTKINETASDFARISAQYFIWISIRSCLIIYSYFKMQQMKSERKKENKINASEY